MNNNKGNYNQGFRRPDLPPYPKAFISAANFNKERNRVFVAMPFKAEHSNRLWEILEGVCKIRGLNIRRGDQSVVPNPVVCDILEEIEKAEIIIADLTGMNPNVLYEVGIAHVRCYSVILLCKKSQKLPFNLSSLRCIFFDLDASRGEADLADDLLKALDDLRRIGPPIIIDDKLKRTRIIINDLQALAKLPNEEIAKEKILFSGGLSAFAIADNEPFEPGEEEYHEALLKEKESLIELAEKGFTIKCILTPPILYTQVKTGRIDVRKHRLQYLLNFLQSNDQALLTIEWAVSPFLQKNQYIIGHISYLEGYKKGTQRGYHFTLRQTDSNAISANISLYEALFSHMETYTLTTYGSPGVPDRREALRKAMINSVKQSLGSLDAKDTKSTKKRRS